MSPREGTTVARGRFRLPRPLDTGRNSWRLRVSATLDVRVLKCVDIEFHGTLELVIEAFSLLNRTNITQVNAVFGPIGTPMSTVGRTIDAGSSRQLEFSIDFEFSEGTWT